MGVKAEFAFDVCWEVYRGAREILDTKRGVSALDVVDAAKFLWRPDIRPRLSEYVADFALAGQAALRGPEWASRLILFRVHYLALAPYEQARHFLGLSEWGWSSQRFRGFAVLREESAYEAKTGSAIATAGDLGWLHRDLLLGCGKSARDRLQR